MNKYCHICGIENLKEAVFCINCSAKLETNIPINNALVQQVSKENLGPQYNCKTHQYMSQNTYRCLKPIIAIAIIISIVAILIGASIFYGVNTIENSNNQNLIKIPVAGGPKGNLQSIASGGNALTTPNISHTAVYGYYLSGSKIGSISFINKGEEYYQGELCYKVEGSGCLNFDIHGQHIGLEFFINGYESIYDSSLRYCNYDFTVEYSSYSIGMEGTVNVDKENNEIISTIYSSMTGNISTVIEVSDDFWTKTNLQDTLYVGYTNEISYKKSVSGYDNAEILRISVIGKEDVRVSKGIFEDCYKVKIEQVSGVTTTTSYIWVDENDVWPKMQISNSATSLGYGDLIIELEEYYKT